MYGGAYIESNASTPQISRAAACCLLMVEASYDRSLSARGKSQSLVKDSLRISLIPGTR
jgi:hypothetical protein